MNDRIGLLTLAAYMTATMVVVVAAFWGIMQYTITARVPSLDSLPAEATPHLATSGVPQLPEDRPTAVSDVSGLDRQRVRFLESMLADKSKLIRQQAAEIAQQAADIEELRQRYDETMLMALESLQDDATDDAQRKVQDGASSPAEKTLVAAGKAEKRVDKRARNADVASLSPEQAEAELMLARAVHDALVSDLESLQNELDKVYEQLEKAHDAASNASSDQLKDTLVLEDITAGVIAQTGRDAVPGLIAALAHSNPVVRHWAAVALTELGPDGEDATQALAEALTDSNPDVRRAAKAALDAIER